MKPESSLGKVTVKHILLNLWKLLAVQSMLFIGLFAAARLAMFRAFAGPGLLEGRGLEVWFTWALGLRYDARIALTLLAPLALLGLFCLWRRAWWTGFFPKAAYFWLALAAFTASLAAVGNYYFYQTYGNVFDMVLFDFFEDDQAAVISVIWKDYPVFLIAGILLAFTLITVVSARKILKAQYFALSIPAKVLYGFASLIMAASFVISGLHPSALLMGRHQPTFTDLAVLDALVPNGLQAFKQAWRTKKKYYVRLVSVSRAEGERLWKEAGLNPEPARTPVNEWLRENKPHVVVTLMESFGSNVLSLDNEKTNDLLGDLRPHFASDFVFRRFISGYNGTALSFNSLFFQSPTNMINQAGIGSEPVPPLFGDTPIGVFKQAGYRVVFICPGSASWYNLSVVMPAQGADECYFQNSLIDLFKPAETEVNDWGMPDEYAFMMAEKLLAEAREPLFIIILTVTNHPPYSGSSAFRNDLPLDVESFAKLSEADPAQNLNMLRAYQYASDAFGKFIGRVKNSPYGPRTIIAGSGDHRVRRIKSRAPSGQAYDFAVPFYLRVPEEILEHSSWKYEPLRPGSHKDIMPTVYAFSLDGAAYQALGGRNLLAEEDEPSSAFGYNEHLWIDGKGAYTVGANPRFQAWKNGEALELETSPQEIEAVIQARQAAYAALLWWQIQARLKGFSD